MTEKKKKKAKKLFLNWVLPLGIGGALGAGMTLLERFTENGISRYAGMNFAAFIILVIFLFWVGFVLHIFLHEAGHLAAGKLSGYKFLSFRVFNFTIIKKDGKYSRKKFTIPGALGQCIMIPPAGDSSAKCETPYLLYNLGGGLFNIFFGLITLVLWLVLPGLSDVIKIMLLFFSVSGTYLGVINLIPVRSFSNDGHNIRLMRKDEDARRAFRIMLLMIAYTTMGVRVKDMPVEWLEHKGALSEKNTLTATPVFLHQAALTDRHEFTEAKALADRIIEECGQLIEAQLNEIIIESLFCELVTERRSEEVERLYTNEIKKYVKATAFMISRQRLLYAYAKLYLRDPAEAESALEKFNKGCASYPFVGDIESERELISIIDALAAGLEAEE